MIGGCSHGLMRGGLWLEAALIDWRGCVLLVLARMPQAMDPWRSSRTPITSLCKSPCCPLKSPGAKARSMKKTLVWAAAALRPASKASPPIYAPLSPIHPPIRRSPSEIALGPPAHPLRGWAHRRIRPWSSLILSFLYFTTNWLKPTEPGDKGLIFPPSSPNVFSPMTYQPTCSHMA